METEKGCNTDPNMQIKDSKFKEILHSNEIHINPHYMLIEDVEMGMTLYAHRTQEIENGVL